MVRCLHPRMAVKAVHFIIARMKLVGKRNRLIRLIAVIVKKAYFVIG